nr:unnamed protein product [Digitaria exilis]
MRGGRELLGLTLWLAFCSLRLHAFHFPFFDTYTSQQDVDAINDLYAALGSPDLEGWTDFGGAEEKIDWPSWDYVKAAGSSARPSFKNSSKDITVSDKNVQGRSEGQNQQIPFTFFTVASMQQHTNNFSDLNLIRETCFGKMYLADHPGGKFSVLKLDGDAAKMPAAEFLKIVQGISELRYPNVEELVGCCVEHGQRLLVYNHFSDITLDSMMHFEHRASETAETLQWDARVAVALEAATALEYLHEGSCRQVVHRHFRPEHVLIDGDLRVSVSGCGLAPFVQKVSDYCTLSYEPPEAAADTAGAAWTAKGDVYSFGVVMLQLLTGRRPYDSSRAGVERRLVQWASPRLHDLAALGKMADPLLGSPPVRSLSRFADIIGRCLQVRKNPSLPHANAARAIDGWLLIRRVCVVLNWQQEAEFRPAMAEVAQDLRRALEDAAEPAGSGGNAQV